MELERISAVVRPRNQWEAIDLGVAMARRWWRPLCLTWLAVSLPVFVLLHLLLREHTVLAIALVWWLKPLYERPLLHILSRALFGEVPAVRQTLRTFPALAARQWLAALSYRRLSLTRSMDLPVQQLEGLAGAERAKRLRLLHRTTTSGASWLTILGAHVESLFYFALLALLMMLTPAEVDLQWSELFSGEEPGMALLRNLLLYLSMAAVAPFYAAAGFALYLNRRIQLEAWDIEIAFRRLARRIEGLRAFAPLLALALVLGALLPAGPAWAQSEARAEARQDITQVLAGDDFHQRETVHESKWLKEWWRSLRKDENENSSLPDWLAALALVLARGAEVILWTALVLLLVFCAWKYRDWLRQCLVRQPAAQAAHAPPRTLFGLELAAAGLPRDVIASALDHWRQQRHREAYGLLYRATLIRLMEQYGVRFHESYTEGECMRAVRAHTPGVLARYFATLTLHWQFLAYGHRLPPQAVFDQLCREWPEHFRQEPAHG